VKVDNVDLNTRYDPHVLPDYGGPFFQHVKATLVQQDIRDVKGKLIPPTKWCEALRPGSLVVATVKPHVSIMPDERRPGELKKVRLLTITIPFYSLFIFSPQFYQLTARRVKVIDSSDVTIPHHPQAASTRKFNIKHRLPMLMRISTISLSSVSKRTKTTREKGQAKDPRRTLAANQSIVAKEPDEK